MLYKCVTKDKANYFAQIFDAGFEVNEPIVYPNVTSLMFCAGVGTKASLRAILDYKPNVNQTDSVGRTALHYAARAGNQQTLETLIEVEGIDIDALSAGGMTPLMYACESGNSDCVAVCLNNSCNPFAENGFGETAKNFAEKFADAKSGEGANMLELIELAMGQWREQVPEQELKLSLPNPSQHFK